MAFRLSEQEIRRRLAEGRNYKRLYIQLKGNFDDLKTAYTRLQSEHAELQQTVATLHIQIAELQTMVFGRKKRPPGGTVVPPLHDPLAAALPVMRSADSYRRPIPPAAAITAEVTVPLPERCSCGGSFAAATTHVRYEEDIPLPQLTSGYQPQLVTKFVIGRAVCNRCHKKQAASSRDLGGAQVTLGPNVRLLAAHLTTVGGMSYAQVSSLLRTLYGLTVSDGEIANMLQKQHETWLPAYHQLQDNIRAAPVVHADETSWSIQELQGRGYAWDLCDAASSKVCFALENSRGARHAKALLGHGTTASFTGVRISDDYGAYRNPELPGRQQLCWVHLYRSIRDLRYNTELPKDHVPYVTRWYEQFAELYQQLRSALAEPYDAVVRTKQATKLWRAVHGLATQTPPSAGEPQKLTKLKAQLNRAGKDRLFICLTKDTPCDNNRAERDLRQLVLKRKRSFGSKTERGAKALATLLSLCTTTWRTSSSNPAGYFSALAALG